MELQQSLKLKIRVRIPSLGLMDKLIGKVIVRIERTLKGDEGFKITFDDNQTLEVVFSSCEGYININDKEII